MMISPQTDIKPNLSPPKTIATKKIENLWENPPEATEAMKKAIKTVKNTFNINEQWDGEFNNTIEKSLTYIL